MRPIVLCILDGCGIRKEKDGNAFLNANKPNIDYLFDNYPNSLLEASGIDVGLPPLQMGNSEVGHMNIGSGRIVYQPLQLINNYIDDKSFFENREILNCINHVKINDSKLHIMGLISDGGVHSHINHLLALLDMCKINNVKEICLHLATDGRDVNPKSAYKYIKTVNDKLNEFENAKISTISGRYYIMDRDNNYDRLKKAYDAICYGIGKRSNSIEEFINNSYEKGITDEFLEPTIFDNNSILNDNDAIITFNYRKDRIRELFTALTNDYFNEFETKKFNNLKVLTFMPVTKTVLASCAFDEKEEHNILGEYLSKNGLKQLRISETEKYAHVTFFFDDGKEKDYNNEKKILIPSPKVATYDLKPEMSAIEITDVLIDELDNNYDIVILNYANGDMVGHTGNYDAAIRAVETIDLCIGRLYKKIKEKDGILIITADHGNCDIMWDENHIPVTSHTTSKVPFVVTDDNINLVDGRLSDIAPTIIELLNLEKPNEMTGNSLIKKEYNQRL